MAKRYKSPKPDFRDPNYSREYSERFPEHDDVVAISQKLVALVGSYDEFVQTVGTVLRRVYDEVIKMPKTGRWSVLQLAKSLIG